MNAVTTPLYARLGGHEDISRMCRPSSVQERLQA